VPEISNTTTLPETQPVTPTEAASLVILRGPVDAPDVLLGRRRDTARFMPGYFVYPGGAVDAPDIALADSGWPGSRFHCAAIRETWEEAGVSLAKPGTLPSHLIDIDPCFTALNEMGLRPAHEALQYIARAITPSSSPIRFDTRFFLAGTEDLHGTATAIGELPEVAWTPVVSALSSTKLSGVTKFALGEALSLWQRGEGLIEPTRPVRVYTYEQGARLIRRESQSEGLV
jgi:8-oxo-dGTP pyrophosphatase MutT (NUDIX family)